MKKLSLIIASLFLSLPLLSQNDAQRAIEKEVNQSLWMSFRQSFNDRDWKTFNSLHTDDVLRLSKWGIRAGDEYKASNRKNFEKDGSTRSIDFSFETRVYKDDIGYEVGYYELTYQDKEGNEQKHYARFHVLIKKVEGQWKIAQDWDTDAINERKIGQEDYESGTALD